MARLLSDDCISLARLIASGASCEEFQTDDGREKADVLREIAVELLLLDASHEQKDYVISDIRKSHRNAYQSWTKEEEDRLMALLVDGRGIGEIAGQLGRQPGAIISRVRKIKERVAPASQ